MRCFVIRFIEVLIVTEVGRAYSPNALFVAIGHRQGKGEGGLAWLAGDPNFASVQFHQALDYK